MKKEQKYKVYVLNLDRSLKRWENIEQQCQDAGIECLRFSAADGYKVKFKNLQTGLEYYGRDIKNKTIKIEKSIIYQITCNPNDNDPTIFNYKGSVNHLGVSLSAGELGIYCSYILIWKDIVKNNDDKVIVLEDDVILMGPNFKQKLENYIEHVPETFDLAYLSIHQDKGTQLPLLENNYVSIFSRDFIGWGTWSILYSNKAAKTLSSLDCYSYPIDACSQVCLLA